MFPHSDIDLLVLAEDEAQAKAHDALARLFALLWDAGLPVGHAVRSAAGCTAAAAGAGVARRSGSIRVDTWRGERRRGRVGETERTR